MKSRNVFRGIVLATAAVVVFGGLPASAAEKTRSTLKYRKQVIPHGRAIDSKEPRRSSTTGTGIPPLLAIRSRKVDSSTPPPA